MPDLGVTPAEARVMWSRQAMTPDQLQGSGFLTEFVLILRRVRQEFVEAFNCYPQRLYLSEAAGAALGRKCFEDARKQRERDLLASGLLGPTTHDELPSLACPDTFWNMQVIVDDRVCIDAYLRGVDFVQMAADMPEGDDPDD